MNTVTVVKYALLFGASTLMNVAFGISSERIYVGNSRYGFNGTVSIVDGTSNAIVDTIPAAGDDPYSAAANPAGTRVYVVNSNSNNVTAIDTATNAILETFAVGQGPAWILVSPDGARLYVTNLTDQNVWVIDTANNTLEAQIPVPGQPFALALNPSGSRLFVASEPYVHVIDTASNTDIAQINVGPQPTGLAYSASTDKLYVTNGNANYVTVVDALSNTVLRTFNWPGRPYGIASSPTGDKVWFTAVYGRQLSVIDTSTDTVENTLDLCNSPVHLAFNGAGTRVYVTCALDSTLSVIDAQSQQVIATIPGFDNPSPLAVTTVPPSIFTVSPSADANGSISPATPQVVNAGATASFTLTPNTGYSIAAVGGTCGGTLSGTTYTTNAIASDCTVVANFISAADQISSLISYLQNLNLQQGGTNTSLTGKLQNALSSMGKNNPNSCNLLNAFSNQVQALSGKQLTVSEANGLIASASQIKAAEGCP